MKVLFITQSLGKGGAERLVIETAKAMMAACSNCSVKIVSLGTWNDYPTLTEGLDIEYCNSNVKLSLTGKSNVDISEFEEIVDRFQPDVIHSHTYKAELVSRENSRKGITYFTHVHGPFPEFEPLSFKTFSSKAFLTRYFERRRIFKRYRSVNNQFITISSAIDEQLRKQLGSEWNNRIHLIPNAIDFDKFNAEPHPPIAKDIQLISVGRMFPVKNHGFLLEVISSLKDLEPNYNWNFLIAGTGPLKSDLEKQIKQQGLDDQIVLAGLIDAVENALRKSHIYLHSARAEPFGLTLLEAMAASLPVVSLDGGGNRDFIQNGVNGFLLDQKTDAKAFSQRIIELVKDKELYDNMAKAANETARKYDIHNYVKQLMELYES